MAIALGLRQGELLGLRWTNVNLDESWLRVTHALQRIDGRPQLVPPKTDRSRRTLYLSPLVTRVLHDHRRRQAADRIAAGPAWVDQDFVFTAPAGGPLSGSTVTHAFHRHLDAAALPRHRFHDLRHTCASSLLAEGANPRVVMDVLRHSHVSVTLGIYSHVVPELQQEALDRLDGWLRPAGPGEVRLAVRPH